MSTSAHHGCFSQSPSYKWSADLPLAIQNQPITFRIRRQVPHESYMSYHTSTTQAPLFHRAWIFQERILAPRVLFFMTGELIFKCCHHTLCECASEWLVHDRNWLYDAALQDPAEWSKHWHDWIIRVFRRQRKNAFRRGRGWR
ncbi:hypothetical protein M7I_0679 [Glarea lozoyensis 74030]|uniref:Heterokaryon incompatibility domain-containing protein n=1 Tax=Glarea lozoyensis (strain ATCC 74030 / MF5533) TaxID=1104152 RepID=H0EE11_GLAL7|nr:hypothetical protein M7I_0679 [Glarea lozoyensis 74030]